MKKQKPAKEQPGKEPEFPPAPPEIEPHPQKDDPFTPLPPDIEPDPERSYPDEPEIAPPADVARA